MRVVRLVRIAAEAESFRLRRQARRAGRRAVLLALAVPFLLAAFFSLQAAFWLFLAERMPPVAAALVDSGANLAAFLLVASPALLRAGEDRLGREAGEVRRQALEGITAQLGLGALAVQVTRVLLEFLRRERRDKP